MDTNGDIEVNRQPEVLRLPLVQGARVETGNRVVVIGTSVAARMGDCVVHPGGHLLGRVCVKVGVHNDSPQLLLSGDSQYARYLDVDSKQWMGFENGLVTRGDLSSQHQNSVDVCLFDQANWRWQGMRVVLEQVHRVENGMESRLSVTALGSL
jgi:hypothetical protein